MSEDVRRPIPRLTALLVLLLLSPSFTFADPPPVSTSVLEWPSGELKHASGLSLKRLSVLTWNGQRFEPVPFQIDEMTSNGMVWIPGSELELSGRPNTFDAKDTLLLWRDDAGSRSPKEARPDTGTLLEELITPDGEGFFYLVRDHPDRQRRKYVHHDTDTGITRTRRYRLEVDPDNELVWQSLHLYTEEGLQPLADSLAIEMSAGLLFSGARLHLDGDNLKPSRQAYRTGPLRTAVHSRTRVVVAGIPVMSLHLQTLRYPDRIEAHNYVELPAFYRATLKSPEVRVALRSKHGNGASLHTARGGKLAGRVDGHLDGKDQALIERGLSTDASWIRFESPGGNRLTTQLTVPEPLQGIPLQLLFRDDADNGSLVGYGLDGWPPERELRFTLRLFFDGPAEELGAGPVEHFAAGR